MNTPNHDNFAPAWEQSDECPNVLCEPVIDDELDLGDSIVAMSLQEVHAMKSGPGAVELDCEICQFYGVRHKSDVTQAMIDAAREKRKMKTHVIGVKNDASELWLVAPADGKFAGKYPQVTTSITEAARYSKDEAEQILFDLMHRYPKEMFRVEAVERNMLVFSATPRVGM